MVKSVGNMYEELFMSEEVWLVAIPLLVATLAGGLVGIERECRSKSAGFRTMILISIGSCLFTILSIKMGGPDKESSRIAASVVAGIGFLGAGAIIKDDLTVRGLTTAASVWVAASLGMAAGVAEYELVGVVTAITLVVLWVLPPIEKLFKQLTEYATISITVKNTDAAEDNILDIFDEQKARIINIKRSILVKGERTLHITTKLRPKRHRAISEILVNEKGILRIEY